MLLDNYPLELTPLFRYTPYFLRPAAIFSPLEHLLREQRSGAKAKNELTILTGNNDPNGKSRYHNFYQDLLENLEIKVGQLNLIGNSPDDVHQNGEKPEGYLTVDTFFSSFLDNLNRDIEYLDKTDFNSDKSCFPVDKGDHPLFIHKNAIVSRYCAIDTSEGPVVLDDGVEVSPFSLLKGPLYIGKGTLLDKVFMANSRIGQQCRLGGEIADSYIGNFTNKHHEGFLGHSFVGDWVNLGALTTTSDLKNNYGKIHLVFAGMMIRTEHIKLGSIIGDFVKTSIGTLLNTGTIIDNNALLTPGMNTPKYTPPFSWGGNGNETYKLDKLLGDTEKIMKRRNQKIDPVLMQQIKYLYPE